MIQEKWAQIEIFYRKRLKTSKKKFKTFDTNAKQSILARETNGLPSPLVISLWIYKLIVNDGKKIFELESVKLQHSYTVVNFSVSLILNWCFIKYVKKHATKIFKYINN